jgi:hypothetical protein
MVHVHVYRIFFLHGLNFIILNKYSGTCAIQHPVTSDKNLRSQSISLTLFVKKKPCAF